MLCLGRVCGSLLCSLGPLAVGLVPELEGAEQLDCTVLGTPRATAVVLGKPQNCIQQCTGGLVVLRWHPHPSTVPLAPTVKDSHPCTFLIS